MTTKPGSEPPETQLERAAELAMSLREVARDLGDRLLLDLIDVILIELANRIARAGDETLRDSK